MVKLYMPSMPGAKTDGSASGQMSRRKGKRTGISARMPSSSSAANYHPAGDDARPLLLNINQRHAIDRPEPRRHPALLALPSLRP